jgi:DNA-binding CsgD family transcriptional regulator
MPEFRKKLLELSQDMAGAADTAVLFDITARALADLGCDDFTFAGSNSVRLGSQALEAGVRPYFTTLSPDMLRATEGDSTTGYSIYMRRFLQHGLESFFSDPSVYIDATPLELDHVTVMHQAGYRRGFLGVLSRIPGHFTAICCHLDAVSDSELDRSGPEICAKLRAIGKMMDEVFLSKHAMSQYGLTPRERDVLSCLADGLHPDQIAHRFSVSAVTVEKNIVNAKDKLSARTRDHAVARALMLGLLNF